MNKKIALSLMSIVTAFSLMGSATFAYFSDSGTSSNNAFAAGTMDLQLQNNGSGGYSDSVTATWGDNTGMMPDGTAINGTLNVKNNGTIDSQHVDLVFANVIDPADTLPGSVEDNPMSKYLQVTTLTWGGTDLLAGFVDTNANGFVDLADLATTGFVDQSAVNAGLTKDLVMSVKLHSSAPNEVQGDKVTTTVTVEMHQAPHASE